ncbi:hypothetical protein [Desulfatitalea alkaliphila]|uniref:Uncharacterized protein n=1 Tax=Desulfatitalea alkaliphila TaxID=2929485 RepID=A0AA41ULK1_9BACT|nr:hypothetical protein [Desulfatitalea alkaliphila]MCJ8502512.1 hypothetical protein [Desulfatitalea alkaliphila]
MIEQSDPEVHPLSAIAIPFAPIEKRRAARETRPAEPPGPELDPSAIAAPALLLDRRLRIIWQNATAASRIWQNTADAVAHRDAPPSLFDLLFDTGFQSKVDNWRQWIAFFLRQALTFLSQSQLRQLIDAREGRPGECLRALLNGLDVADTPSCASTDQLRQTLADGRSVRYAVFGTTFGEQRLIIFEGGGEDSAAPLHARLAWLRQHQRPVYSPLCILAARLDKADILQDELLDDAYAQLVESLLQMAMKVMAEHGGLFHHQAGTAFQGIFLPSDPTEPLRPIDALACALNLKRCMADLTREWKIRIGWRHPLRLNMGLHAAEGPVRLCNTACGEQVMVLGDNQRTAQLLARLADDGRIWATKNLMRRLAGQELQSIRFGVHPQGGDARTFVAQGFARISDLASKACPTSLTDAIANVVVTQLMERQG